MAVTTRSRSTRRRCWALASALAASFVPVLVSGSQPATAAASDLFISEYVEGSSFNKAIEIYNGTGAAVDLASGSYKLELYSNVSTTPSQSVALSGTIADGDVLVLAHASADAAILAATDVQVRELTLRTPTLDDVFLELTGNHIEQHELQEQLQ